GSPIPPGEQSSARLVAQSGTVFVLSEGANSFGRRPSNRYILEDDSFVSGAHAVIEQEKGRCYLIDLNSTNGTRLNDRRIAPGQREPLSEGDEVIFGQTPLTFHVIGE
ncbi:MAG: FHA domain-containing protein, partial [Cytophagales bacterium]|nr:FHA domain-containing protein [Armatimonadota bacterium]